MKRMLICFAAALLLGSTVFYACSDHEESGSEKGTIEKAAHNTAKELTREIRTPIEKARAAKNSRKTISGTSSSP